MNSPNRISQVYGYAVCLISVIIFLGSSSALVSASFDLSNPVQAERFGYGADISSFEAYKASQATGRFAPAADSLRPRATDAELRQRWQVLRDDRIAMVTFRARRSLATSGLLMIAAVLLFAAHWSWVRRRAGPEVAA